MTRNFKTRSDARFINPLIKRERRKNILKYAGLSALPLAVVGAIFSPDSTEQTNSSQTVVAQAPVHQEPILASIQPTPQVAQAIAPPAKTSLTTSSAPIEKPPLSAIDIPAPKPEKKQQPADPAQNLIADSTKPTNEPQTAQAELSASPPKSQAATETLKKPKQASVSPKATVLTPEPETLTKIVEPALLTPNSAGETPANGTKPFVDPADSVADNDDTQPTKHKGKVNYVVQEGDSLARIFADLDMQPALLYKILNSSKQAKGLAKINPGDRLRFTWDEEGKLTKLAHEKDALHCVRFTAKGDTYIAQEVEKDIERRIETASGVIQSSLFADARSAGLTHRQILDLASIFKWDLDFARELRAGDHFNVVVENHFVDDEKVGDGYILAAEVSNRGKVYRAVRYTDGKGRSAYYTPEGQTKKRAFTRSPIEFARITSGFSPKRWHPVLKKWRAHRGVDYGAPTGTPVRATGDGVVKIRQRQRGYGKVVYIQHDNKTETVYGHLSRFASRVKKGSKVRQGQIIGYVGQTGLATGPHLHYEFRVNGKHKDPLRVGFKETRKLAKGNLKKFKSQTHTLLAQLDQLSQATVLAQAEQ